MHSVISNVFINIHEYESWVICVLDNEWKGYVSVSIWYQVS